MCAKCKVVTTFSRHLVFDVPFYERKNCPLKGDSEATINPLIIVEMPRYLKEHVCGTYHPIYVIQLQKTAFKCW